MKPKLTYSNVVATIALFAALGGGAYAASVARNSVGSAQIKPNAVKGGDVKESTLSEVPKAGTASTAQSAQSAQELGGVPSDGFLPSSSIVAIDTGEIPDGFAAQAVPNISNLELLVNCNLGNVVVSAANQQPGAGRRFDFQMVRALNGVSPVPDTGSTPIPVGPEGVQVLPTLGAGEGQFHIASGTFTYQNNGYPVSGAFSLSISTVPVGSTCRFTATGVVPTVGDF